MNPPRGHYTGREIHAVIGYITHSALGLLPAGVCVFQLEHAEARTVVVEGPRP